jgi:NADPH2:quinone reductase
MQGLTALTMVARTAPAGKTVLVHAGAGGVGSNLVQLARIGGAAAVLATAGSPAKLDAARDFGTDASIDYTQPDWPQEVLDATEGRGPDLVYDAVGGEVRTRSFEILADEGMLVIYGSAATGTFEAIEGSVLSAMYVKAQGIRAFSLWPAIRSGVTLRRWLDELIELSGSGRLVTVVGSEYPLSKGADAHRALQAREVVGKVVLVP